MSKLFDFFIVLFVVALVVEALLKAVTPLVPYMVVGGLLLLVGGRYVSRRRNW